MATSFYPALLGTLAVISSAQADSSKYVLNCTSADSSLKASVLATPAGNMMTLKSDWVTRTGTLDAAAYELVRECGGVKCAYLSDVSSEIESASMVVRGNDAALGWSDTLTMILSAGGLKISEVKMTCEHDSVREKLLRAYWTAFKEAHTESGEETARPEDMARIALDLEKLAQAQADMTTNEVQDPKKEKVALHKNRPFVFENVVGGFDEQGNFVVDENIGKTETPRLAVGCVFVSTEQGTQKGKGSEDTFRCMFPRFVINDIRTCWGSHGYSVRLPMFRLSSGSHDRVESCPWMRGSKASRMSSGPKKPCFVRTRKTGPEAGKK
jgi:hypothetical protein